MKFDKFFIYLSYLTIISAFSLTSLSFYWLFVNVKPIEFKNLPHKVEIKTIKSGGYLIYDVEFCKYTKHIPVISKTFIDGIIYVVSENQPAVEKPVGCRVNKVQVYVPKALPKGEYVLKTSFRYQLNPLRYLDITTETEKFMVVNEK